LRAEQEKLVEEEKVLRQRARTLMLAASINDMV
jgi:hypothetical protein